jgi:hypothetical protein
MEAMQADLFDSCLIDTFFPHVGEGVVRLLRRSGVELAFPAGQTCCGQPPFNTGFRDLARAQARRTLAVLEERRVPVIVPSGLCASMIRHGYLELLGSPPTCGAARVRYSSAARPSSALGSPLPIPRGVAESGTEPGGKGVASLKLKDSQKASMAEGAENGNPL